VTTPDSARSQAADEGGTVRTSITMPTDLAAFARSRAGGNFSGYIQSLVEREQRRVTALQRLTEHGYTGDLAPTEAGRARARARLEQHRAKRATSGSMKQKAA
jgi:hypothetical protein